MWRATLGIGWMCAFNGCSQRVEVGGERQQVHLYLETKGDDKGLHLCPRLVSVCVTINGSASTCVLVCKMCNGYITVYLYNKTFVICMHAVYIQ